MSTSRRDFHGYGNRPPAADFPGGARVALSFVINLEEGAELSVSDGDERNESVYEAVEEVVGAADPCMESHYEYGTRAGYWRLMDTLAAFDAHGTLSCCARAARRSPLLVRDALARGHEVSCHGERWESHAHMAREREREIIASTHASLTDIAGRAPVGWHTRSAASTSTRALLLEHGGFLYDSDAYNDDLPWLHHRSDGDAHVVLPYSFDTNDMRFQPGGGFVHAEDFARYCIAAFDQLWEEGADTPKMMSVGLHLRIIGRPARIGGLRQFLEHVRSKGDVWIARRDEIAHHWRRVSGLPTWRARSPETTSATGPITT
ncbi:polysaccharide deacetylase family protein [Pseudazoarcus pumilus]|uniref:Chitin deacetylase n=1 Tax=Pseudazoarcus pumilus TaxID=2067960 RepID=A0A2I6S3C2_9RHOO|nr:polysaccharide deacetylase family protein [Pseudazoarcus pumilus]AUN93753.1 chitin deacetylase [Pseudazoarcus pumilus]